MTRSAESSSASPAPIQREPGPTAASGLPRRTAPARPRVARTARDRGYDRRMALLETELLQHQAYIDGRWLDSDTGETFPVLNPATGEELAQVPRMGAAETRRAIEAAQRVFPDWRAKNAKKRA